MINKNLAKHVERGTQAQICYPRHASATVAYAEFKDVVPQARSCWRRNPHTGRLEMHWQFAARRPIAIATRQMSQTVPTPEACRVWIQARVYRNVLKASL